MKADPACADGPSSIPTLRGDAAHVRPFHGDHDAAGLQKAMPGAAVRHRRTPALAVLIALGLLSAPLLVPHAVARSSQSATSTPRASMPDPTPGVIRITASRINDQYRRWPFSRMYAIELDHDIRAYRFVRDGSGRMLDAWRPHWEKLAHLADPITHALKEPQNAGPKTEVLVRHYEYPNTSTRHPPPSAAPA